MPGSRTPSVQKKPAPRNEAADMLRTAFLQKKKGKAGFSLKFLANRLSVSAPFLSQVFNSKRTIPIGMIDELCLILDLDSERRDFIFRAVLKGRSQAGRSGIAEGLNGARAPKKADWSYQPVSKFWALEDWYFLPLLNCTLLKDYDGTAGFLAQRLALSAEVVEDALTRLKEAGFLKRGSDGLFRKSTRFNDFQSAVSKESLRKFHRSGMAKAATTLAEQTSAADMENRLITTFVLTTPRAKLPWAKQRIREFLEEMTAELAAEPAEEVYQLGIQFFPLTRKPESA